MARILGIDYGKKRTGLSKTDPMQIIVSGLTTLDTKDLFDYLKEYCTEESVEKIVFGLPEHQDGTPTALKKEIDDFIIKFSKLHPDISIDFQDEAYSTEDAKRIMLQAGLKKMKRRDKNIINKMSAVVILQRFLKHI